MKKLLFAISIALILTACSKNEPQSDYTQFVNPLIGTDYTGNTYPGAQVPFGMVQLSPDNGLPGWDRIAGYFYPDSTIAGFSHTHLSGTGAGDLYDISFLPVTEPVSVAPDPLGIHSKFSHSDESASAGYYQVRLTDYDINVELTATQRCGIQRYTFPKGKQPIVLLNLAKAMNWDFTKDTEITVIDSVTIAGYRFSDGWARDQKLYFCTRFSRPFTKHEITADSVALKGEYIGMAKNARFEFDETENQEIVVSTALSCTSVENARKNLAAEVPTDDFATYLALAKEMWNNELARIEITT
ncbi:MAG: lipoprotein, partial [Muribaculaceae bacterium]|nr:lipoprotein [Muribaculaceae bacterium]